MSISNEARDTVRGLLAMQPDQTGWRELIATPPGSLLETVLTAFRETTDFPLEVPFIMTPHFMSAWLLQNGTRIHFAGTELRPDLWTIMLAESGSGKSETAKVFSKVAPEVAMFPQFASSAKFMDHLEQYNNSLWLADEFAQVLKKIQQPGPMEEMKDYLLRLYDGSPMSRDTRSSSVRIEEPALTILGLNVPGSFARNVNPESLIDGFCQRFLYLIARFDADRPPGSVPLYRIHERVPEIQEAWTRTMSHAVHQVYTVGDNGENAFIESFRLMRDRHGSLPASFFRRIMFRGVRYALLYHLLLRKSGEILDAEDMAWAARMCGLHLQDAGWLLREHGMTDLERMVARAEEIKQRIEKSEGRLVKPRDIVRGVHGLKSTAQAKGLLALIT